MNFRASFLACTNDEAWSRRAFLATRRRVYEYDCKTTMTNAHHILRLRVNNVIRFARRVPHLATGLGLRNVRARRRGGGYSCGCYARSLDDPLGTERRRSVDENLERSVYMKKELGVRMYSREQAVR